MKAKNVFDFQQSADLRNRLNAAVEENKLLENEYAELDAETAEEREKLKGDITAALSKLQKIKKENEGNRANVDSLKKSLKKTIDTKNTFEQKVKTLARLAMARKRKDKETIFRQQAKIKALYRILVLSTTVLLCIVAALAR